MTRQHLTRASRASTATGVTRARTGVAFARLCLAALLTACGSNSSPLDSQGAGAGNGGSVGAGGSVNTGGSVSTGGSVGTGGSRVGTGGSTATTGRGLHVQGTDLVDGNGEKVVLRGIEHVIRWADNNAPPPPWGSPVGVWDNDSKGTQIPEMVKTGANALRLLGPLPSELEPLLHMSVIENHMWVSIASVDWRDATTISTIAKYAPYVSLHAYGEGAYRPDPTRWQSETTNVISKMRALGYTSVLEILSDDYGQDLDNILTNGDKVFDSDPLGNVVFGVQMYSNVGNNVSDWLDRAKAYHHTILVGACLFKEGIAGGWGTTATTYKEVWDGSYARSMSSYYWSWHDDQNQMSSTGNATDLTAVGQYLINDSPAALRSKAVKSAFILNSTVN